MLFTLFSLLSLIITEVVPGEEEVEVELVAEENETESEVELEEGENEEVPREEESWGESEKEEEEKPGKEEEEKPGKEEEEKPGKEEEEKVGKEEEEKPGKEEEEQPGKEEEQPIKPEEEREEPGEKTCADYADQASCVSNGCSWNGFGPNGVCAIPACDWQHCTLCADQTTCPAQFCLWNSEGRCISCGGFTDQSSCEDNKCYWGTPQFGGNDNVCRVPPTCGPLECGECGTEELCRTNNCLWLNEKCSSCGSFTTQEDCQASGTCTWSISPFGNISYCRVTPVCNPNDCDFCLEEETCKTNSCIWGSGKCSSCFTITNETSCEINGCTWTTYQNNSFCMFNPPQCDPYHCNLCAGEATCNAAVTISGNTSCVWSDNTCVAKRPPPPPCDNVHCDDFRGSESDCKDKKCVWVTAGPNAGCFPCCNYTSPTNCSEVNCSWSDYHKTCNPWTPSDSGSSDNPPKSKKHGGAFYFLVIGLPIIVVALIVIIIIIIVVVNQRKRSDYSSLNIQ